MMIGDGTALPQQADTARSRRAPAASRRGCTRSGSELAGGVHREVAVGDAGGRRTPRTRGSREHPGERHVVFNDQNPLLHVEASAAGSVTLTVVPAPTSLSMASRAPMVRRDAVGDGEAQAAAAGAGAAPPEEPPRHLRQISSGGMPIPWSLTSMTTATSRPRRSHRRATSPSSSTGSRCRPGCRAAARRPSGRARIGGRSAGSVHVQRRSPRGSITGLKPSSTSPTSDVHGSMRLDRVDLGHVRDARVRQQVVDQPRRAAWTPGRRAARSP